MSTPDEDIARKQESSRLREELLTTLKAISESHVETPAPSRWRGLYFLMPLAATVWAMVVFVQTAMNVPRTLWIVVLSMPLLLASLVLCTIRLVQVFRGDSRS